jgi:hypothetical protein
MKSVRYILLIISILPFTLLPLSASADISYTGQLQQELVSWDNPRLSEDGFQIRDGGEHQQNSHDVEGASYLALQSTFRLTPNHQGLASFHFDLNQEDGLEQYEAYVGIQTPSSNWRMGAIASPYKSSTAGWDPFLATFMQARGNGGASIHHNGYVESSIVYQSDWWGADMALLWSPENGSSLSMNHSLTKWDFALAYNNDESSTVKNSAAKGGVRYRSGEWITTLQYESLKNNSVPARASYFGLSKRDGETEYGGNIGMYRSDNAVDVDLNYFALGMKHALAKNNIIHFGYRLSSAPEDGSQSEKAVGLGFRYSF